MMYEKQTKAHVGAFAYLRCWSNRKGTNRRGRVSGERSMVSCESTWGSRAGVLGN